MRSLTLGVLGAHAREAKIHLDLVREALTLAGQLAHAQAAVRAIVAVNALIESLGSAQVSTVRGRFRGTIHRAELLTDQKSVSAAAIDPKTS